MNIYVVCGIIGIISSILAALADVPLIKPGKVDPSNKLTINAVAPWWADVSSKRFIVSFWLSFLGQPGSYVVMWLLSELIGKNNEFLGNALKINTFIGCFTGLICHAVFCMKPLIYQNLQGKLSDEESARVINAINPTAAAPMVIGFLTLWLGGTVIVASAILTGALNVPKWCLLLNPVTSCILLMILKKLKVRTIGALGVGFILFSILLIIAGAPVSG